MDKLKIALFPFVNLGTDSWDYLALGLQQVVLNWLKKNPYFHLITVDLPAFEIMGDEIDSYFKRLNAAILITGNLKIEEEIFLEVELFSLQFKTYARREKLKCGIKDVMELSVQLTSFLEQVFPYKDVDISTKKLLPNGAVAFRDYLLGHHYFERWERGHAELALAQFKKVTAAEPDFIPAYLGIAKAIVFLVSRGFKNAHKHYPETIELLDRMLLIDPSYGELYIYKGIIEFFYLLDWDSAYKNIEKGLQNFSEASEAYAQLSLFWYGMREFDKAIEAIHIAMEYNPLSVSLLNMKGDVLISAERYKEAEAIFKEILLLQPDDKVTIENLMFIAGLTNNKRKALHYLYLLEKDAQVSGINFSRMGFIYAKFGFEKQSKQLLQLYLNPTSPNENHYGRLANIYCAQGDYEKAMDALEKYFSNRMGIIFTLAGPQFLPLRNWKRYKQLESQIKLPQLTDVSELITIKTDLKQTVRLNPRNLLYAKSESNYTELVSYNNFRIEKTIARASLSKLLAQLPAENFFQCHRTYLINTTLAYHKTGNARGYLLTSVKYGFEVPVSRSKIEEMKKRVKG